MDMIFAIPGYLHSFILLAEFSTQLVWTVFPALLVCVLTDEILFTAIICALFRSLPDAFIANLGIDPLFEGFCVAAVVHDLPTLCLASMALHWWGRNASFR